jgi:hypothetical protein
LPVVNGHTDEDGDQKDAKQGNVGGNGHGRGPAYATVVTNANDAG